MTRNIFDESDPEENSDGSTDFQINESYAKRFEHNKKREALQQLEEMKKKGLASDSEESSEEELVDDPWSTKTNIQFWDTLIKFKRNDPIIYQKDTKFYSDNEEEDEEEEVDKKKEKPMYLKDVVAKQLLEDRSDFGDEPVKQRESQSKVYSKQQEENLKVFHEVADGTVGEDDNHDDDELFQKKKSKVGDDNEDKLELELKGKIEEFYGDDAGLDENELFMKRFFMNKMWEDKGKACSADDFEFLSEDEKALEEQEKCEAEYNFRYEEGTGDRILGHARHVEGSVRKKKNNSRKRQRENKQERMLQAELERKEELKHLKNLKRKEIEERLAKVRAIAGIGDGNNCKLSKDDLEEEFDPVEYDKKMKEMFGMDYYDADDVDPGFGSGADNNLEKPDFNKEDELLGLPKDWDVIETGAGFKVARERSLKRKAEKEGVEDVEEGKLEDDGEDQQYKSKRKGKHKISLQEKVELQKELEEYYKLDYEDTIGDLRTRFKYKSVPPSSYGLSAAEILMTDDKELNQYVSLKKLAPYVQKEWKVPKMKRYQMKLKINDGDEKRNDGKNKKHNANHFSGKTQQGVSIRESPVEKPLSKRSKKRRRQAEIKITQSRLLAYGKISANPKKQKKQKH